MPQNCLCLKFTKGPLTNKKVKLDGTKTVFSPSPLSNIKHVKVPDCIFEIGFDVSAGAIVLKEIEGTIYTKLHTKE